jgi:hypothetical protein
VVGQACPDLVGKPPFFLPSSDHHGAIAAGLWPMERQCFKVPFTGSFFFWILGYSSDHIFSRYFLHMLGEKMALFKKKIKKTGENPPLTLEGRIFQSMFDLAAFSSRVFEMLFIQYQYRNALIFVYYILHFVSNTFPFWQSDP